jgi:hypothetical protein
LVCSFRKLWWKPTAGHFRFKVRNTKAVTQIKWSRPDRLPHVYNGAHPAHIYREIIESSAAPLGPLRNKGTKVTFHILVEELSQSATTKKVTLPFRSPNSKAIHVLIVEDNLVSPFILM